jgi:hypothetical protein
MHAKHANEGTGAVFLQTQLPFVFIRVDSRQTFGENRGKTGDGKPGTVGMFSRTKPSVCPQILVRPTGYFAPAE